MQWLSLTRSRPTASACCSAERASLSALARLPSVPRRRSLLREPRARRHLTRGGPDQHLRHRLPGDAGRGTARAAAAAAAAIGSSVHDGAGAASSSLQLTTPANAAGVGAGVRRATTPVAVETVNCRLEPCTRSTNPSRRVAPCSVTGAHRTAQARAFDKYICLRVRWPTQLQWNQ